MVKGKSARGADKAEIAKWREVMRVMGEYVDLCAEHGFDGHQAAEFRRRHDSPEFLQIARWLDLNQLQGPDDGGSPERSRGSLRDSSDRDRRR